MSCNCIKQRAARLLIIFSIALISACANKVTKETEGAEHAAEARLQTALQQEFESALELQRAGRYDDARDIYVRLLDAKPGLTGPELNLGIIAMKQGSAEQAEAHFQQVLEHQENNLHALNYLGVLSREAGEFDAAEGYYRRALDVDANYLPALRNLAILLDLYRGRLVEALSLYEHYQAQVENAPPELKDWIFDIKSRISAQGEQE